MRRARESVAAAGETWHALGTLKKFVYVSSHTLQRA
jgi:hypothetical protein